MKKYTLTLLTGLAFASSAQAGEDYSAKAPPTPIPEPCLWTWFAGGSGGYVDNIDNDMWTLHVGAEYKCPGSESSHAVFLEVGWTDWNDDASYGIGYHPYGENGYFAYQDRYNIDFDYSVVPITINYKYENRLFGPVNWYVGGGVGVAISSIDVKIRGASNLDWDDTETNFYGHVFAGVVWNITDAFEAYGGVRYIYMDGTDKISTGGINDGELAGILDDDVFYELGIRFNF
jgi:opacity protein-like surface antigen